MRSAHRPLITALAAVAALAGACAGDDGASPEAATTTTPDARATNEWTTVPAGEASVNEEVLAEILSTAEAGDSRCVAVARDGEMVTEEYFGDADPEEPREVFSVTKSLTALLVGIAIDDGLLELDEAAADHIPEWQGTDAEAVTVENLLANDSGRYWDFETDYTRMPPSADNTAFAVELDQEHPPGEVWIYNNAAIQTLEAVMVSATGQSVADFAEERVFEPLGMEDSWMRTDASGHTLTYIGLQTTCGDLARLGQLVLDGGTAPDGTRVISEEFLEAALEPSTELTSAYGYLWWLNRPGPIANPVVATSGELDGDAEEAQLNEDVPEDVVWASGLFDQNLVVFPSEDLIGVRIGADPPPGSGFNRNTFTTMLYESVQD